MEHKITNHTQSNITYMEVQTKTEQDFLVCCDCGVLVMKHLCSVIDNARLIDPKDMSSCSHTVNE